MFYLGQDLRHTSIPLKEHANREVQEKSIHHDKKVCDDPVVVIFPPKSVVVKAVTTWSVFIDAQVAASSSCRQGWKQQTHQDFVVFFHSWLLDRKISKSTAKVNQGAPLGRKFRIHILWEQSANHDNESKI